MPPKKAQLKVKIKTIDSNRKPNDDQSEGSNTARTLKKATNGQEPVKHETPNTEPAKSDTKPEKKSETSERKRKQPGTSQAGPEKAQRRSTRAAQKPEPKQIIRFLLSEDAIETCRPEDENRELKSKDASKVKTYSASEFTPFEELLSAAILSRPISHALGVRSIRTIFNDPYNFTTPRAIQEAGPEKRLQALWDARTQHKDKTAQQIGQIADVVVEKFSKGDADDTSLQSAREAAGKDMDEESDLLTRSIKGIGKTGMSIFFRRIQWLWEECFPYIDERTEKVLQQLGIPIEPEELKKLVEEDWDELSKLKGIAEGKSIEIKKRRAFVVLLERAVGAGLENKVDEVLGQAGKT